MCVIARRPLSLYKFGDQRELFFVRGTRDCSSGENIQGIIPEVMKSEGVFMMPHDKMTKVFMFDKKYRISLAERSDWATGRKNLPATGESGIQMDSKG